MRVKRMGDYSFDAGVRTKKLLETHIDNNLRYPYGSYSKDIGIHNYRGSHLYRFSNSAFPVCTLLDTNFITA